MYVEGASFGKHAAANARDSMLLLATRSALGLVALVAGAYILLYLVLAYYRVPYPFDLEQTEGALAQTVHRLLEGKPIYTLSTLEYVPLVYTPLYFYLAAPLMWLMGPSIPPLRVLSFLASLGCFYFVYRTARRETGSAFAGFLGVGLYAATFRLGGAWFDTARVDSLMIFFLLAGFYVGRFRESTWGAVWAALLFSAALLTKQSTVVVVAPMLFALFLRRPWHGMLAGAVTFVVLVLSTLLLNLINDGWYWYYIVEQVNKTPFRSNIWIGFWTDDLAARFSIGIALALLGLAAIYALHGLKILNFYLLGSLGMLVMAYLSRLHGGGYDNVLMTAFIWLSLLAGMGFHWLLRITAHWAPRERAAMHFGACALVLVQFMLLIYNPFIQVPSRADYAAGERILDLIATTEGPVFIPTHNFLPALVNKQVYCNRVAYWSVMFDPNLPGKAELAQSLTDAISSQYFGLAITNNNLYNYVPELVAAGYQPLPSVYESPHHFWTVTGVGTRPDNFFVRPGAR